MTSTANHAGEPVRLGPLEQQVLNVLWDSGRASIRQVIAALGGTHAYTTIATVLGNLERKGVALPHHEGRSVYYSASQSRERHAAHLMQQALSTSTDRAASILHFVDTMSDRDAQLLREYLAERERP